jgi:tetratricopeptide (TPR) repeat protein
MAMFARSQVRADDPRLQAVHDNFRRNLEDICTVGQHAGAPVLLCTVATNWSDSAPFASLHRPDLSPEQADQWDSLYARGNQAEAAGNQAEAIRLYEQAAEMDDQFADLAFRRGRCQAALGRYDESRASYRRARDLDALPFRAETRINDTIRRVAADRNGDSVYLVDVEQALAAASPHGIPGEDLFYEHVHMNFHGNYLLARAVFQQLGEILPEWARAGAPDQGGPLSERQCAERLACTGWNHAEIADQVAELLRRPPFTDQLEHRERDQRMHQKVEELRRYTRPDALREAVALYEKAIGQSPDDWPLHWNLAKLLRKSGDEGRAGQELNLVVKLLPQFGEARAVLAQVLSHQGKTTEALVQCEQALQATPDFAQEKVQATLANILAESGEPEQSLPHFAASLRLNPNSAGTHSNLGNALLSLGRVDEAVSHFKEAMRLQPDQPALKGNFVRVAMAQGKKDEAIALSREMVQKNPERVDVRNNLASLLVMAGRHHEALTQYQEALRIDPKAADVHCNLGTLLARAGRIDEAVEEYQEALRLRPGWAEATQRLAALQAARGRPLPRRP